MSKDMIQQMRDFFESDAGKESIKKFHEEYDFKEKLKLRNVERIKKMFIDQKSFNKLVKAIIAKHDDRWVDGCYKKGSMPYPWHLL